MLKVTGVTKIYGAVRALDDVSATFAEGEIHAVLGENGAGKSTLMHVIAGFAAPDQGSIELDGVRLPEGRPFASKRLGIRMIHQHFTLVPGFTVAENLALAQIESMGHVNLGDRVAEAEAQSQELGWTFDPSARTGSLAVGIQQRIEILKNLLGESRVLIFDEPTAVLSPEEVEDLFRVMRKLRTAGKTVILIAHKLKEVMAIADRVTVLRRGRVVGEAAIEDVSAQRLAEWMVGEMPASLERRRSRSMGPGLRMRGVTALGDRGDLALRGIDLEVDRGEILGVGGVDGNGQVQLAEALLGVRDIKGTMEWQGTPMSQSNRPPLAYIPQDRQTDGLALSMSVADNLLIEGHRKHFLRSGPFLKISAIGKWAAELIERFEIKVDSPQSTVGTLSGGNQQKVVVARALDEKPELLVAVNPTRGLDVKAADYVHRTILSAAQSGAAVVLISTDLDELAALADRTVYLSRGAIVTGAGAEALLGGTA